MRRVTSSFLLSPSHLPPSLLPETYFAFATARPQKKKPLGTCRCQYRVGLDAKCNHSFFGTSLGSAPWHRIHFFATHFTVPPIVISSLPFRLGATEPISPRLHLCLRANCIMCKMCGIMRNHLDSFSGMEDRYKIDGALPHHLLSQISGSAHPLITATLPRVRPVMISRRPQLVPRHCRA